jgi:UDP-N-acetylmuramoylalanine--D-glutamate ligase
MMNVWNGKNLVIVGAARQGLALAKCLSRKGVRITVTDQKDADMLQLVVKDFQGEGIQWELGGHPLSLLDEADGLSLSGGIPLDIPFVKEALSRGIPLTNDSQIFLELTPCPVIGITGSAGKTTTTMLVGSMVVDCYGSERSWVGGNIGNPLIAVVDDIQPDHLAVVELSSFQLELMTLSPQIACVLNVTPNHLDRHHSMEAYTRAKARILDFQTESDIAVLNRDDPGSWSLEGRVKGRLMSFGLTSPQGSVPGTFLQGDQIAYWDGGSAEVLFPAASVHLRGRHNLVNVLAACAIGMAVELPLESIRRGVESIEGVEHRLQQVRRWKNADWVDDSIATAPERTIAAIKSFDEPLVLLAGGKDKDLPWEDLARLIHQRVRYLILFGEAADLIEENLKAVLEPGQQGVTYRKCRGLEEAVSLADEIVQPGDVVLLSPGGTSFDEFVDFAQRGDRFRQWVQELN